MRAEIIRLDWEKERPESDEKWSVLIRHFPGSDNETLSGGGLRTQLVAEELKGGRQAFFQRVLRLPSGGAEFFR